jgi:hypothetical protein
MVKERQPYQLPAVSELSSTIALGTPDAETPFPIALASEAVLDGWTREYANTGSSAASGVTRHTEPTYGAYRKTCGHKTTYDEKVPRGERSLARAAYWLVDAATAPPTVPQTPPAAVASQLPLAQTAARLKQPLRGR